MHYLGTEVKHASHTHTWAIKEESERDVLP
jgi:hypothetical protein